MDTTTETQSESATQESVADTAIVYTAIVYTSIQTETLVVQLVAWQDEGFRGIVTQGDSVDLFPEGAELTVIFEDETEIILENGELFPYTADAPSAGDIEWAEGTLIAVNFTTYEEYHPDNGFYNRVYAATVTLIPQ